MGINKHQGHYFTECAAYEKPENCDEIIQIAK